VLQAAGSDMEHLLKITTYLTNIDNFPAVIEARSRVFPGQLPASTLIVVPSLFHPDFLIEVEGIAAIG
jgi:enamine deaminase RidA (YjgF/YER057c/UK114 family)